MYMLKCTFCELVFPLKLGRFVEVVLKDVHNNRHPNFLLFHIVLQTLYL